MRIAYVTNVRLPNERAHGYQIAETVKAMVSFAHEVEVIAPFRKNTITQDFWEFYGMPNSVQLHYLGKTDYIASSWTPGVLGLFALNAMMRRELKQCHLENYDVLYTRTPALLGALLHAGKPVILELHRIPKWQLSRFVALANQCQSVICLTTLMKDELIAAGVEQHKISVEPDGVDLDEFSRLPSRYMARTAFDLQNQFVVGYAGALTTMGISKGAEDLIAALKILHAEDVSWYGLIAGGPEEARIALMKQVQSQPINLTGQLTRDGVKRIYAAADVLVYLAPKSNDPLLMRDTSPLKVFEYMASRKPIVSADIPPVHDVLDERTVVFYEPGNPTSLADALRSVRRDEQGARMRIARAFETVEHYTWRKRTQRILSKLLR